MSYDMTMCRCSCNRAMTCHRHLQFLRYLKDNNSDKPSLISMHSAANGQIDENCLLYWDEVKTEKR